MRIICPYTKIDKRTKAALPASTEYIKMTSFNSYQQLFCKLWKEGKSFILVEHDVQPLPGAIKALMECGHLWCACPYESGAACLGCIKISAELIALLPDLWETMPLRHWAYCDDWFNSHAEKVASVHMHQTVIHNHAPDKPTEIPRRPLSVRVRRQTDNEIEVAYWDPTIEYEFGCAILPGSLKDNEARIKSDLVWVGGIHE